MAQIGRASGARRRPVEVLCANDLLSSQLENASFMAGDHLVQGPRAVLRVSSLPRLRTGDSQPQSELKQREVPRLVVR